MTRKSETLRDLTPLMGVNGSLRKCHSEVCATPPCFSDTYNDGHSDTAMYPVSHFSALITHMSAVTFIVDAALFDMVSFVGHDDWWISLMP